MSARQRKEEDMDIAELLEAKKDEILRIAAKHGAQNVRVFGSAARRETDGDSDIDLVVEMEQGRSLLDLAGFWRELNALLGIRVDVVTEKGLRDSIREEVLREAVLL